MRPVTGVASIQNRLLLGIFFVSAFLSYTWGNQFPYFYHSDEESKALQLLYGYHNYWHPMLMLNATRLLGHLTGLDHDAQSITLIGRTLSALCASVGVVCLIQFAWRRRGMFTALLTGFLLLTLPLLFEVSHYCKEDPALFMGLALTLLTMDHFLAMPELRNILLLGAATGIATSAKYPGAFLIAAMLPVIFLRCRKITPLFIFLLAASVTLLTINWQWVLHSREVFTGIHRESSMLTAGHDGVASQFPHTLQWKLLLYELGWPILLAASLGFLLPQRKAEVFSVEFALGLLALLILGLLGYSAKISDRYLLPVLVVILYLAACGVDTMVRFLDAKYRPFLAAILVGIISIYPLWMLRHWVRDFETDSRAAMSQWIFQHIPKDDLIATSLWTRLPGFYAGQFVSGIAPLDYVADFGTLDDLRKMGYRWVLVADVESQRFDIAEQTGKSRSESAFQHRRRFYQELRREADLRWSEHGGVVYNLNPGLKLYQLHP